MPSNTYTATKFYELQSSKKVAKNIYLLPEYHKVTPVGKTKEGKIIYKLSTTKENQIYHNTKGRELKGVYTLEDLDKVKGYNYKEYKGDI